MSVSWIAELPDDISPISCLAIDSSSKDTLFKKTIAFIQIFWVKTPAIYGRN